MSSAEDVKGSNGVELCGGLLQLSAAVDSKNPRDFAFVLKPSLRSQIYCDHCKRRFLVSTG